MTAKPLTTNQQLVLGVLKRSPSPLSAYDILHKLRNKGIKAPLQVYRALEVLIDLGVTHRLESLNAFVACSGKNCAQGSMSGFMICNSCGRAEEFCDSQLHEKLQYIASDHRFMPSHSVVEISGICARCSTLPG
ncbi:MAG TPA: transcriptional repressor [Devosia sp.]|nr:transcriptional repressor [Devosia sp.]